MKEEFKNRLAVFVDELRELQGKHKIMISTGVFIKGDGELITDLKFTDISPEENIDVVPSEEVEEIPIEKVEE